MSLVCDHGLCVAPAESGPWDCVDTPLVSPDPSAMRPYAFRFFDIATNAADGSVRLCAMIDPDCATPLLEAGTTDATGMIELTTSIEVLAASYLELRADGFPQSLWIFDENYLVTYEISRRAALPVIPLLIATTERVAAISATASATLSPSHGHLVFYAYACPLAPGDPLPVAEDIAVELDVVDSETEGWYTDGATILTSLPTAPDGTGGFINAPAGYRRLTGRYQEREVSTNALLIRAEWMTWTLLTARRIIR
jgi:hypothetical protein